MSQIQIVVGIVSDLDAINVPDPSMTRIFVPDFALESFMAGDEPIVGGQIVFVHKANARSNLPLGEVVTCSCHIYRDISQIRSSYIKLEQDYLT